MKSYLPLVVAAVLLFGGCGKKEGALPVAPQPSLVTPGDALPPSVPMSPFPVPDVPKGAEAPMPHVELPHPGQAGDHSSPGFQGGGQVDKKK